MMKRFKKFKVGMVGVALCLIMVLPQVCLSVTTEEQLANWPAPMWQGEELEKVREW